MKRFKIVESFNFFLKKWCLNVNDICDVIKYLIVISFWFVFVIF